MAAELTERGVMPAQKGDWTATAVRRVLARGAGVGHAALVPVDE